MVRVEDKDNAVHSLTYLKEEKHISPLLVVCDFSPSLIAAIREVFGSDVLQIDGFHVMQLLNNGVRSDLVKFRNKTFRDEINELYSIARWLLKIQREIKKENPNIVPIINVPPDINPKHHSNHKFLNVIIKFLNLIKGNHSNFKENIIFEMEKLSKLKDNNDLYQEFNHNLRKVIPRRELTEKGFKKLVLEILKKLKKISINLRKPLVLKKKKFSTKIWALFYQPENLTEKRKELLEKLLSEYPELKKYRKMMLQVGSIYRKNLSEITKKEIQDLEILPEFSKELKTAITTIKDNQESIYRFIKVFESNPDMGKECRANTEFLNRNFKAPFKKGLNCVKKTHLKAKIELQMGCEVRWLLSEEKNMVIQQT